MLRSKKPVDKINYSLRSMMSSKVGESEYLSICTDRPEEHVFNLLSNKSYLSCFVPIDPKNSANIGTKSLRCSGTLLRSALILK